MAHSLQFGPFLVDPDARAVFKGGERLSITSKGFEMLLVLIQNRARVVTKQDLLAALWPEIAVEEANIAQHVYTLRKLLGDNAKQHQYIATVPGHGYRFIACVNELSGTELRNGSDTKPDQSFPIEEISTTPAFISPIGSVRRDNRMVWLIPFSLIVISAVAQVWWRSRPTRLGLPELVQRQITFNSSENAVLSGAISPEGKFLAYSDWTGLHVKSIEKGIVQNVGDSQNTGSGPASWSVGGWLVNSNGFAANLLNDKNQASLWLARVGGPLSKLEDDAFGWSTSADGAAVAFTRKNFVSWQRVVAGQEIWSYNFRTGEASRLLAAQDPLRYSDPKWTPDGKSLAFIAGGMGHGTLENNIQVCDGSGRRCRTAVTGLNLKSFAVLKDGRLIVSKAEPEPNGLSCGLWITANAGQELHRLTDWQGSCLDNLTLTSDESLLALRKPSYLGTTYVAELLNNGTQISKPVRFNYNKGQEGPQAWLPDNRTLLLASNQKGHWEVLKQTDADPTAQPLVSEARSTGHPAVTADGKWILYMVGPRSLDAALYRGPVQLMRVPVIGGPSAKVTELLGSDLVQCPGHGPRSCILIRNRKDPNCLTFSAFDPLSGIGAVVASYPIESPGPLGYALSGDGTRVAITHAGDPQIDVLSLDTGVVERLPVSSPHDWNSITWAPGDQGLFVPARTRTGIALLEIGLSGDSHILWDQRGATRTWGIPSPNGRLLAILNWTVDSNMWTVQGF